MFPSSKELKAIANQLRESQRIQSLPPLGGWKGRPEYVLVLKARKRKR